jgi:ferredoxin
LCDETAPNVFKEDNPNGWAFVFRQPNSEEDEIAARQALEGCPTKSIGDDGR